MVASRKIRLIMELRRVGIAGVALAGPGLAAGLLDLGDHLPGGGFVLVVVHHHRCALAGQSQRDGPPDAA